MRIILNERDKTPIFSNYCIMVVNRLRARNYFIYEVAIIKIENNKTVNSFFKTIKMDGVNPLINTENFNSKFTSKEDLINFKKEVLDFIKNDILITRQIVDLEYLLQTRFKNTFYDFLDFLKIYLVNIAHWKISTLVYASNSKLKDVYETHRKSNAFFNCFFIKEIYEFIKEKGITKSKFLEINTIASTSNLEDYKKHYELYEKKDIKTAYWNHIKSYKKGATDIDICNYSIIDLETTGFDDIEEEIIEVGIVKVRNDEIVNKKSWLVKPKKSIPKKISVMTSITDEMVADKPRLSELREEILSFLGNDIILGFNTKFDIQRLETEFNTWICDSYVDILHKSRKIFPKFANHKLQFLTQELGISHNNAHRALGDSIVTKEIFDIIKNKLKTKEKITEKILQDVFTTRKLSKK